MESSRYIWEESACVWVCVCVCVCVCVMLLQCQALPHTLLWNLVNDIHVHFYHKNYSLSTPIILKIL